MAKKGKRRGKKNTLRIVPAVIVLKDTGLLAAADAIMDPNVTMADVSELIVPPTMNTVVDVWLCKVMRGAVGGVYVGKFGGRDITLL